MLLEFGFRNFCSFREGAQVSLRLDANCPKNISQGRDFATAMAVKGANAAGKTHVLKALSFLGTFCSRSFAYEPDSLIPVSSFFDNSEPTELYAEFRSQSGTEYRYEVELTDKKVIKETIYHRVGKRRSIAIERIENRVVRPRALADLKGMIVRDNVSIISTFNQYGRKELAEVYDFFGGIFSNVGWSGYTDLPLTIEKAQGFLFNNPPIFEFVKRFIKSCDTGVDDIDIRQESDPTKKLSTEKSEPKYATFFTHIINGKKELLVLDEESSGTKALFRMIGVYATLISVGHICVHDEFDIHLHPHLTPKIIELFTDPVFNKKGAQLIVSTHDDRLMDLLGRYRSILVNKEGNESYLYRIDEMPGDLARNDRSMLAAYNDGKLGGVPRL